LSRWQYDSQGTASLCPTTESVLEITDSETQQRVQVPQIGPSEAYKYLGVHISFDGNMSAQKQAILEKCRHFQYVFAQSQLSHTNMQMCYRTVFGPAIRYVLPATAMDEQFLDKVQRPIITLVLAKMGFNQHMPCDVAMAPLHFGGLGLMNIYVEQGTAQVLYVLCHIRSRLSSCSTLYVLLETHQVSAGIDENPLEVTSPCRYIESPWVHSVQTFLHQCNASIRIPNLSSKHPLREHDRTIMSYTTDHDWSITDLRKINNCRLFLQVLYLSEIVSSTGTHILDCALHGHTNATGAPLLSNLSRSTIDWPTQPRPDSVTWGVWKRFLSTLTSSQSNTKLRVPLGHWYKLEHPVRTWHYRYNPTSCMISHHGERQFSTYALVHKRTRTNQRYCRTPISHEPASIPVTPTSITDSSITMGIPPVHTFVSVQHTVSPELPLHYDYLVPDAIRIIQHAQHLVLATDGGLLYDQTTFGCVIVVDSAPVVHVSGRAPSQHWPSSLTAEAFGAYYAAKTVNDFFPENLPMPTITFLADNQILLDGLSFRYSSPYHIRQSLQPEHELLYATIQHVSRSPELTFQHVKGHQSPDASDESSWNNTCDALATQARLFDPPPGLAIVDHRSATLILNGMEVTSRMAEHLRAAYSSQALREYYLTKFPHWPPEAPDDIDWYIKGQALKSLHGRHQKTILQMMHGWLPVNAHPGSGNSDEAQNCPYCQTTPETMSHFLSCNHQSAIQTRQDMIRAIKQHLRRAQTNPDMCQLITSALDIDVVDPPVSVNVQAIHVKQSTIGWDHVLKGNLTLVLRFPQSLAVSFSPCSSEGTAQKGRIENT
jgi:hypothetical protein